MKSFPDSIIRLIDRFSRFPGIGKKTAQRMAFHILKDSKENAQSLADAVKDVKSNISSCSICGSITEDDPCVICGDPKRNNSLICVVEVPSDIFAFERTSGFNGVYHVLSGVLSPLDGIGPEDLALDGLFSRVEKGEVVEVILATSATVDGKITSHYIKERLINFAVTITALAHGIPVGGELDYLDDGTLSAALKSRRGV